MAEGGSYSSVHDINMQSVNEASNIVVNCVSPQNVTEPPASDETYSTSDKMEQAIQQMQSSKYPEALKVLRQLCVSQDSDKLDVTLLIAECELLLQIDDEDDVIRRVKDAVPDWYSTGNVMRMSRNLQRENHFLRALILFRIAYDFHRRRRRRVVPPECPDATAKMTRRIISEIERISARILKSESTSRDIAIQFAATFIEDILDNFRVARDVSDHVKALVEAFALNSLSFINGESGDYQNAINYAEEGLLCLEKQFGESADKRKCYSWLLANAGAAHEYSGRCADAEQFYDRALALVRNATDYRIVNQQKFIKDLSEINLKNVRKKLRKNK